MLKYRLTNITKTTKLYFLYIIVYIHIAIHRRKKSFSVIKMKLSHCITLQKYTEKTILLYIIITVSRRTYLGIDQSMKRKFVSSATNTWKSHMFDTDSVICSCFFLHFLACSNFIIIAETTTFSKIRL